MEPQKVKVKLVTTITHPDQEQEVFELWSEGSYVERAGKLYVTYDEVQESVSSTIRTTMKMGTDEALILRSGGLNMRLPFSLTEEKNGSFEGEFGSLMVTTTTRAINLDHVEKPLSGRFLIDYELLTGGTAVGNYKLELTYTEGTS